MEKNKNWRNAFFCWQTGIGLLLLLLAVATQACLTAASSETARSFLAVKHPVGSEENSDQRSKRVKTSLAKSADHSPRLETFKDSAADWTVLRFPAVKAPVPEKSAKTRYLVLPALADTFQKIDSLEWIKLPDLSSESIRVNPAIARLNAGFFDPKGNQSISYVYQDGKWTGNPAENERLVNNTAIAEYLPQILNRSEFRTYWCGVTGSNTINYAIVPHNEAIPMGCKLLGAVGAGPRLLPARTDRQEAFWAVDETGKTVRDPIGIKKPNARSAIGLTADNSVMLVVAAQNRTGPVKRHGATLDNLTQFMKKQGAVQAMALDGGSSSSLWVNGNYYFNGVLSPMNHQTFWARQTYAGEPVKRKVLSVIQVYPY
ncbi:MAG: phosphodiester glycosidase family protein [Cyanobacteria bacterium P01_H01_bin.74]